MARNKMKSHEVDGNMLEMRGTDGKNADDSSYSAEKHDGFSDMFSKILHQNIGQRKAPVLAKRTTTFMREIENDRQESHDLRLLRQQRKKQRTRQMIVPKPSGSTSVSQCSGSGTGNPAFEKQLRKLATRGVVTLFNTIATTKRSDQCCNSSSDVQSTVRKDTIASTAENADDPLVAKNSSRGKWNVLKDDFLIVDKFEMRKPTLQDWDKATGDD